MIIQAIVKNKTKEKVNRCPKGISLANIFRKFYGKRKKELTILTAFYISNESSVKI